MADKTIIISSMTKDGGGAYRVSFPPGNTMTFSSRRVLDDFIAGGRPDPDAAERAVMATIVADDPTLSNIGEIKDKQFTITEPVVSAGVSVG